MEKRHMIDGAGIYQITIEGVLDPEWSDWLDGFRVTPSENGGTILTGTAADQAALYGLIARLGDLNLPLLAVQRLENTLI